MDHNDNQNDLYKKTQKVKKVHLLSSNFSLEVLAVDDELVSFLFNMSHNSTVPTEPVNIVLTCATQDVIPQDQAWWIGTDWTSVMFGECVVRHLQNLFRSVRPQIPEWREYCGWFWEKKMWDFSIRSGALFIKMLVWWRPRGACFRGFLSIETQGTPWFYWHSLFPSICVCLQRLQIRSLPRG